MIRKKFNTLELSPAKPGKIYKRPPRWDDRFTDAVQHYASQGLTQREVAAKFHTSFKTMEYWMRTKPAFRKAWERGRDEADERVEQAFFKSAIGYSHPDIQVFMYKGESVTVPITRHYPPNAFAAYKWLTIRQRERWCDVAKMEINNTINIQNNINMDNYTMEELMVLEKLGLKTLTEKIEDGPGRN